MKNSRFDTDNIVISWCPGCGNFPLLDGMKGALEKVGVDPVDLVLVSGIGQAGKTPHYIRCNMFNGLHGRAVPLATGIKAANPGLTVIAQGGDGDMYGEGGNHLIHASRRNPDITCVVHNNMVYGLTKGQASPTSQRGFTTALQHDGVISRPLNPLAVAISLGTSFVARAFSGDQEGLTRILATALDHRGFSLVDILQPCVTFNKVNTFQWFKDRVEPVPGSHDPTDRAAALKLAFMAERLPVGILYLDNGHPPFEENLAVYNQSERPLYEREVDREELKKTIDEMR